MRYNAEKPLGDALKQYENKLTIGALALCRTSLMEILCENRQKLEVANYFSKKLHH